MGFCAGCGSVLPDAARFCPNCGATTHNDPAPAEERPASPPAPVSAVGPQLASPRNPNAGCGKVAAIGCGVVVVVFILLAILGAIVGSLSQSASNNTSPSTDLSTPSSSGESSASDNNQNTSQGCNSSTEHSNQAWDDINAGDYAGAYRNADTAVSLADACNSGGDYDSTKAAALFARAIAEHHLAQGDSRTDLNQAITLYASCETDAGYYGTHAGAVCETAEQNAISWQTNWEMNR